MPDVTIAVKDTYDGSQLSRLKADLREVLALQRQLTPHGMPQTGAVGAAVSPTRPAPGGSPVSTVAMAAQVTAAGGASRLAAQQANPSPTLPQQMQAQQGYGGGYYGGGSNYFPQMIVGGALQRAGSIALGETSENLGAYGRAQLAGVGVETLEGANAPRVIAEAREEAKNTFGADYNDILGYQNQLVNQGTSREDSQKLVKNIGDINAAMGGSSAILQRVMYNLSQVESQGRLTGLDNRQFQQARINLNPYLAKQMGVETSEVRERISAGDVTSEMVRKAIYAMGEDPKFKDRGRIITETTLPGQFEKTKDEFNELREVMGEGLAPTVGKLNEGLRATIELMKKNPALAKGAGLTAGAVGVTATVAGTAFVARATMGMFGQIFPALQGTKGTGIQNFLFGGGRGTSPANPLFVAPIGAGLGGGLSGATGAAARAGAAPAGAGAGAWYARSLGPQFQGAMGMRGATMGSGIMGAGLGIGAGLGAREDYKSDAAGLGVGLSAAALAAFNPAAAALIGAAEVIRAGQKHSNDNEDKRLEEGNGLSPEVLQETQGESAGQLIKRRDAWFDKSKEQRAKADAARGGFYNTGFDPFGKHADLGEQYDRDAMNSQMEGGKLNKRIQRLPAQEAAKQDAADWEALKQAAGIVPNEGPGMLVTNAKNIEVGKVGNNSDGTQTILLTIPMHPRTERMVSGMEQATRT
jgi:tape measure domain-containing protein